MTGIERGRVKYVRVIGPLQWPWDQNGISWRIGIHADPHRKKVYGVVKVHEDGSVYFNVPVPTEKYNRSYENLIKRRLVNYRDCLGGMAGFRTVPPLTHGSHRSKLVDQIRKAPCKADITREEFIKIVTWIDANVPYYGTYRGKRNLKDKDHPDFRLLPLAGK